MTDLEKAARQALEALELSRNTLNASRNWFQHKHDITHDKAITALRQALEQPAQQQSCYCPNCEALTKELAALKAAQQEPVAYKESSSDSWDDRYGAGGSYGVGGCYGPAAFTDGDNNGY